MLDLAKRLWSESGEEISKAVEEKHAFTEGEIR
jgi:hypothetical protein